MDLLRIGICDDEQSWHKQAKIIIEAYASAINCPIELSFFFGKDELFGYEGAPFDAIFMDVELEEENGIEAASELNEKWPECAICYVTNYLFYATDTYKTEHIYFVLKEQFEKRIGDVFEKLFHLRKQTQEKLFFEVIGGTSREISLSPKDILYFERNRRRTQIHTTWGIYEIWDKIGEIEEVLPELDFVRCHNSYIVYFPAARELTMKAIIMKDGTEIPVSRNYASHVKSAFTRWAAKEIV